MLPKNQRAQHLLQQCNAHCELEVDGDIDIQMAPLAVHAGADMLVARTAIFTDEVLQIELGSGHDIGTSSSSWRPPCH